MGKVIVLLLVYLMIFTSCNKINQENGKKSVNKSSDKIIAVKDRGKSGFNGSKTNGENKNYKDIAFLKGEIILKDGLMKQILSKLDIYMSKLPPKQVELIRSLRVEGFKSVYFVMNEEKFFIKIKGLDILGIIDVVNKFDNVPPQNYKSYRSIKYFIKNEVVIASDGKNSYISSAGIPLKDILNYDMGVNERLKSLINESKNNGFYVSFAVNPFYVGVLKNVPPFIKSLKGVSVFSFKGDKVNKLEILAKLTPEDAAIASDKFRTMYQMYLPMILKQAEGYKKLISDKKDLTHSEKDAYKVMIKNFKEMITNVEIQVKKENLIITVPVKDIEATVTLAGVMAAIAIPAYTAYIRKSRISMVRENFKVAERFVRNEFSKGETGDESITNDAVKELNSGNKKSPLNEDLPAFKKGSKALSGVIVISKTNLRNVKSGESVTIYAPKGNKKIYFDLKDVTIIKE